MIPKSFHFIWFGGDLPEEADRFINEWTLMHSGCLTIVWREENLGDLINQPVFDRADEIAPNNAFQLKADIARLEILHRYGGVYIDCDFEPKKPLDELLDGKSCFAAWEEEGVWINNAIMGCEKGDLLMQELIMRLPSSVEMHKRYRPNVMTGPQFLTRIYRESERWQDHLKVLPQRFFYPYSYNELERKGEEFPEAYAVHHWNNKRRKVAA